MGTAEVFGQHGTRSCLDCRWLAIVPLFDGATRYRCGFGLLDITAKSAPVELRTRAADCKQYAAEDR